MLDLFKKGESFYYANRNTKQVEKCATRELIPQHPIAYIAKKWKLQVKYSNVTITSDASDQRKRLLTISETAMVSLISF